MTAPPQHRAGRRSLLPMVLTLVLLGVVVAAALRGGNDEPTLGAAEATATPTVAPTGSSAPGVTGSPEPAPEPTATPGPTVEPTPTPGRSIEDLPLSGPGTFTYAPAAAAAYGTAPYRRFNVAAEDGSGVDPVELATFVDSVLSDQRSWIGDGVQGFQRVGEGEDVAFTLAVAAPQTVDKLCLPLTTESTYSCGTNGWIALNLFRWETATEDWPGTLDVYRHYLVNHEVGHYILGPYHENTCHTPGDPAPIMMQQTIDLLGCAPNGWVYPANAN